MGCYCHAFRKRPETLGLGGRKRRGKRKRKLKMGREDEKRGIDGSKERRGRRKSEQREHRDEPQSQYHTMRWHILAPSNIPVSFPIANNTDMKGHSMGGDQAYIWMGDPSTPALAESTSNVPLLGSMTPLRKYTISLNFHSLVTLLPSKL